MNTLERLQLEFEGPTAALVDISSKYLGISAKKAGDYAAAGTLAVPAFRLGSQKSPWLVNLTDLADLIDRKALEARTDWRDDEASPWPIPRQ